MAEVGSVVRCDACPVLCRIREGKAGACDPYANARPSSCGSTRWS